MPDTEQFTKAMLLTKLEAVNRIIALENENKRLQDELAEIKREDQEWSDKAESLERDNERLKEIAQQSQEGINALFLLDAIDHVYDGLGLDAEFPIWQNRVEAVKAIDFKALRK